MNAVRLVSTENISHKEWMYYRNTGITGSRIAAIMGESPYGTPLSVYLEMMGQSQPIEQTEAMYFGTVLEDFIAWEYTNREGLQTREIKAILQHPVYEIFLANIDREIIAEENGILEIKNVGEYKLMEWKNDVPRYYYLQGQWYLGVTGLNYVHFAAFIGGNKMIIHKYARDEALIAEMQEKATDFWYCHIEPQIPPNAIEGDSTTLKGLYPQHEDGKVVELGEEESSLAGDLWTAKVAVKQAEDMYEIARVKIEERMGDAEVLSYNGIPVATWKTNIKGTRVFNVKE